MALHYSIFNMITLITSMLAVLLGAYYPWARLK